MFLLDPEIRTNLIRIGDKGSKCLSKMSTELIKCSWSKFRQVQSSSFYIYIYTIWEKEKLTLSWIGKVSPDFIPSKHILYFIWDSLNKIIILQKSVFWWQICCTLGTFSGGVDRGAPLSLLSVSSGEVKVLDQVRSQIQLRRGQISRSGEVKFLDQARSKF